ncbi:MAG: Na(+)/H(+) antiporter subunit B [Lachnospiraceae bacterium]
MFEKVTLILLIILAIASINTVSLRKAVIFLAIFSLISSFAFLIYRAPDVAIAEAIIGAAFTTIIFLVAIQQQKGIHFYILASKEGKDTGQEPAAYQAAIDTIEQFLWEKELEPKQIRSAVRLADILYKDDFDYILLWNNVSPVLYGRNEDHHLDEMETLFAKNPDLDIRFIRTQERVES